MESSNEDFPQQITDLSDKFYETRGTDLQFTKSFVQRDPALFTDFSHFPEQFPSIEEALLTYNRLGLQLRTQFRKYNIRRTREGFATMFTLCCHMRQHGLNKLNRVQLKRKETFECPVQVKFKWNPARLHYLRCRSYVMQHTHALKVKDRSTIVHDAKIHHDIQLWLKCGMAVCQITRALQAKYKTIAQKIIYADVYNLSKQLTGHQPKDEATEQQMMLKAFSNLREQEGWVAWQTNQKEEICSFVFKTKEMIEQLHRFGQMVFVDASVSKKQKPDSDSEEAKEYHILVLSGISSEGSNVLFGCAVLEDITLPSIAWALNHFNDSNVDPETVIVDYHDDSCVRAVQTIFTNSHVLFCQNSVKTFLNSKFAFLKGQTKKEKFLSKQDMFDMAIDLITEPCPERFNAVADTIFQTANDYLSHEELKILQQLMFTKEMWSNAFSPKTFTCGTHNLNRALAVSKLLNSKLLRGGATLLDILNLVKNQIEFQTPQSNTPLSDIQTVYHHPILRYLRVNLTNFAFQLCLHQYMFSHNLTFRCQSDDIQVQNEQTKNGVACSCEFYTSYGLPCCHLFALWNLKQIKSLPTGSVKQRWLRIYGVEEANITSEDFRQQQPSLCHRDQYKMVQNIRMEDGPMLYDLLNIQKLKE